MAENKPPCKLIGENGNVYNLIMLVSLALKRAGQPEKAEEFQSRVVQCGSYDEALVLMMDYVEIE